MKMTVTTTEVIIVVIVSDGSSLGHRGHGHLTNFF